MKTEGLGSFPEARAGNDSIIEASHSENGRDSMPRRARSQIERGMPGLDCLAIAAGGVHARRGCDVARGCARRLEQQRREARTQVG